MFELKIETGNAAFEDEMLGHELSRILRIVAQAVQDGRASGVAFDSNGNRVGRWTTTED